MAVDKKKLLESVMAKLNSFKGGSVTSPIAGRSKPSLVNRVVNKSYSDATAHRQKLRQSNNIFDFIPKMSLAIGENIGQYALKGPQQIRTKTSFKNEFSNMYNDPNLRNVVRDSANTGAFIGGVGTKAGLKQLATLGGLNTAISPAFNRDKSKSYLQQGLENTWNESGTLAAKAGLYAATNPLAEKVAGGIGATKFVPKNIVMGAGNVAEDVLTSKYLGLDPELTGSDLAVSFLAPGALDAVGKVSKTGISKLINSKPSALIESFIQQPPERLLSEAIDTGVIKKDKLGVYRIQKKIKGKLKEVRVNEAEAIAWIKSKQEQLAKALPNKQVDDTLIKYSKNGAAPKNVLQDYINKVKTKSLTAQDLNNLKANPELLKFVRGIANGEGTQAAAGGMLGTEFERDEEGNVTGLGYDPVKGAIGLGAMGLTKRVSKGNSDEILKSLDSNAKYKSFSTQAKELIASEVERLRDQIGGVGEIRDDLGDITSRYSENAPWYREFYESNKRAPTNEELFELAEESLRGGLDGFWRGGGEDIIKQNESVLTQTVPQAKQVIEKTGNQYKSLDHLKVQKTYQKVSQSSLISIPPQVQQEVKNVQKAVNSKVNILDYLRTPDRVLNKIGLGEEAKLLKQKYNDYLDDLPKEIDTVTKWYDRVKGNAGSEQRIFQYLDGQGNVLEGEELKVAKEIEAYLSTWADKLGLPKDKRIAHYITHIFEQDFIQKEFDPDLAKIIENKVPSSVYDPFLQQRLGKQGYVEDAFRALDAYVKRATRKYHMDQALKPLEESAKSLDVDSWKYVKSLGDKVNLRPAHIDNLIDNFIKSTPVGYRFGQRPVANISRKVRQAVYRGTLGLNVGSALRNLTQGSNTYAQLGEKYTSVGYLKSVNSLFNGDDELARVGVLRDNMIQDRQLSATKKFWEKADKALFYMFETVEKINRGAAYYGAKQRALEKGLTEESAIQEGLEMARKTQFTFGSVDTPVWLQGDVVKLVTQFQSYNLKQSEFLGEMLSNKEYAGMVRWLGANTVMLYTIGQVMGWDFKDFVPFSDIASGERTFGETPAVKLAKDTTKIISGGNDEYGNPIKPIPTIINDLIPFAPAGVQAKKTIQGLNAYRQGASMTGKGRMRFPIEQNPSNLAKTALLGQYSTPEAREYFDSETTPLSENQTRVIFESSDKAKLYKTIMSKRQEDNAIEEVKEKLKSDGGSERVGSKFVYMDDESGDVKTITLKKAPLKTSGVEYAKWEKQAFADAKKILNANGIESDKKYELIQELGLDAKDVEYFDLASQDNIIKSVFVKELVSQVSGSTSDRSKLLQSLVELRRDIQGQIVLESGLIDDLVDDGVISKEEGKALKNVKITKDGKQAKVKMTGRGKSAKLKKVKFVPLNIPTGSDSMPSAKNLTLDEPDMKMASGFSAPQLKVNPIEAPRFKVKFNL